MGQGQEEPIERWTAKRRAALILRVLKGETSVPEAARQHGLRVAEVENWHHCVFIEPGREARTCANHGWAC